jgi:hypothetical protein
VQRSVRPAGLVDATSFVRALTLLLLLLATHRAGAQNVSRCGSPSRPWVSVEFAGQAWQRPARAEVVDDLRARFRAEQIDVCLRAMGPQTSPVAAITLSISGRANLSVTIELHDAVTRKRVGRDVSLAAIPADGRPLATAIAADELLRASWAEVALERQSSPREKPPPQVDAAVRRVLPQASRSPTRASWGIGSRAGIEHYDRHTELGVDFFLRPRFARTWGAELALGLRDGSAEPSRNGQIDATASAISLGVWAPLVRSAAFELSVELRVRAARVVFTGEPVASASGREVSGWAVYGRAGLSPSLRIVEPLRLSAALGLGAPMKTFAASDDSQVVTGMRGLELFASLGLLTEL